MMLPLTALLSLFFWLALFSFGPLHAVLTMCLCILALAAGIAWGELHLIGEEAEHNG